MGLLPSGPVPVKLELESKCIILHGPPKVGKTTALDKEGVMFFDTESRCEHVRHAAVHVVKSFQHFVDSSAEFVKQEKYKTMVIDSVSNLWNLAADAYCARKGIKNMLDEKYKEGYGICMNDLYRELFKIRAAGKGLWLVAHSTVKPIDIPMGEGRFMTKEKWVPDCHDRVLTVIRQLCYATIFMEYIGGKRIMHPNLSDFYDAGTCLPMEASGKLPSDIIVPEGACGYELFKAAWEKAISQPQSGKPVEAV